MDPVSPFLIAASVLGVTAILTFTVIVVILTAVRLGRVISRDIGGKVNFGEARGRDEQGPDEDDDDDLYVDSDDDFVAGHPHLYLDLDHVNEMDHLRHKTGRRLNTPVGDPKVVIDHPKVEVDHPKVKPIHLKVTPDDPKIKSGNPKVKPDDPKVKNDDPKVKPDDPKAMSGNPKVKSDDPKAISNHPGTGIDQDCPRVNMGHPKVNTGHPKVNASPKSAELPTSSYKAKVDKIPTSDGQGHPRLSGSESLPNTDSFPISLERTVVEVEINS